MTDRASLPPWSELKQVLADALELEPEQRVAFVRSASAGDAALRTELESLLAAAAQASALDTGPPIGALDALASHVRPEWTGRLLGDYRLLGLVARGGMGEVYRAERADGRYEQKVAVKVVRAGDDNALLLERFAAERRILAALDHPNLAKLLDAGSAPDGTPFFVMELVDGMPIDAYCEQHGLALEARLRLFRTVCQVVDYAHRQGVVHRDLKPSNVLVTRDGIVKLVDFGIAKRVGPLAGGAPERTATSLRVLTPEYASPEQVRGEAVTPASDIYALGVLLYRLLTQASPYGSATDDSYALTRAICDTVPQPPSRALQTAPRALRRQVQGDIDAVILMALRKEPQRRYASAEALGDDLFRHLEGLPVRARRGAWNYKVSRFVLRHRKAVGAVLLANLALVAGIAFAVYQAYEANRQRERAERHFASVRKLANVLMFDVHKAIQTLPGSTGARKLLVDNVLTYLQQLSAEAQDDKTLQLELAASYRNIGVLQFGAGVANLGDSQGALASYERALALLYPLTTSVRSRDAEYRDAQQALAVTLMRKGTLLSVTGKSKEALAALSEGSVVAEDLAGADRSNRRRQLLRATMRGQLSQIQWDAGDFDAFMKNSAIAASQLELLLAEQPDDIDTGVNLATNYSVVAQHLFERDATPASAQLALEAFGKSLAVFQRLQASHPLDSTLALRVAIKRTEMGRCLMRLQQPAQATELHRQALGMLSALVAKDPGSPEFRADEASVQSSLSTSLLAMGDVTASVTAATAAVIGFEALPVATFENRSIRYEQGLSYHQLGRALERQSQLPGRPAAAAAADRRAACERERQALPIFEEVDKLGISPGNTGVAAVRAALRGCA